MAEGCETQQVRPPRFPIDSGIVTSEGSYRPTRVRYTDDGFMVVEEVKFLSIGLVARDPWQDFL